MKKTVASAKTNDGELQLKIQKGKAVVFLHTDSFSREFIFDTIEDAISKLTSISNAPKDLCEDLLREIDSVRLSSGT